MRINTPKNDIQDLSQVRDALELILSQPTAEESPPCDNCNEHIPAECSSSCVSAAASLSSDPARHPIESKIVPLVFEMSSVRLVQPCWSCEGHFNQDGDLWKLPQLTFYSMSPIYPQLLLAHINELKISKKLAYEWHIVLTNFGNSWHMSYNIEPNLNHESEPHLGKLQVDLGTIAEGLHDSVKRLAKGMLLEIEALN